MPKRHYRAGYRFGLKRNGRYRTKSWKRKLASRMRLHKTKPERVLWARLKGRQLGKNFYAQKIILGYIADFWCPAAKLVVEVDGPCHLSRKAYDAHRDMVMKSRRGILTMRFTDQEVYNNLPAVVAMIAAKL